VQEVQAHPQRFRFVENLPADFLKIVFEDSKNGPTIITLIIIASTFAAMANVNCGWPPSSTKRIFVNCNKSTQPTVLCYN